MRVIIRTDSSYAIGSGHLMRCLSLADGLIESGHDVRFVCRELPGHQIDLVEQRGFTVYRLPFVPGLQYENGNQHGDWLGLSWQDDCQQTNNVFQKDDAKPEWIVVDHYSLDNNWEKKFREMGVKLLVVDDLADREHDCDLLLDQNLYANSIERYLNLLNSSCVPLLGPNYALLRSEFSKLRANLNDNNYKEFRVLVFFGGSDVTDETSKTLTAIEILTDLSLQVDVVVGVGHENKENIKMKCSQMTNVNYHCPANNMAKLMMSADLSISGGGSTTWERCCLGLPSLTINVVEHQVAITEGVEQAGAAINLGMANEVSIELICSSVRRLVTEPELLDDMRSSGMRLVDGLGVSKVIDEMNRLS